MAKAREPKVFRSMDDLPLMLTPWRTYPVYLEGSQWKTTGRSPGS